MATPKLNAAALGAAGLSRDQVFALQQAAKSVTASPPQVYTWISNDAGATWGTSSPQSLTATFARGGIQIATQTVTATRVDLTGAITLVSGAHTGEQVSVTFSNNGTQIASATLSHDLSLAQTTITFQALKDGTAIGSYSGGPGK